MILLGIDPGSVRVGFGVIEKNKGKLKYLAGGLLGTSSLSDKNLRLQKLEKEFTNLIQKTKPELIGIEKLFFSKNQKTALEVAQARGVLMNIIAKTSIPYIELSPPEIKLAISGNGKATKKEIGKMLKYFINLPDIKMVDDTTDALAIAIVISNKNSFLNKR